MPIHDQVLATAQRICGQQPEATFKPADIVHALPELNERSVRTHVVSRCCVNAPRNHQSWWPYFERVGHGTYRLCETYRPPSVLSQSPSRRTSEGGPVARRETIHAVITESEGLYVAECLEVAAVTQGESVDETLRHLREALALYLEGEDPEVLGVVASPRLSISMEMPLVE